MTVTKPVSAGFRCDPVVYAEIRKIALLEKRSIASVISLMVETQVSEYWKTETIIPETE